MSSPTLLHHTRRLDTIESAILEILPLLRSIALDVGILKFDVGELKSDVADLKSDVGTLKSDVSTLKFDVAELKSDVVILKSDVAELKSDVATIKSDVKILKSDVIEIKEELVIHRVWLRELSGQFSTLEHKLDRHIEQTAEEFRAFGIRLNNALGV